MSDLAKVVWSEGMHLAQHHFQAQSRYFEDVLEFTLSHLFFKPYGIASCELDAEALRNGRVAIVHARGVMKDGLAFDMPDADPPPAPLPIAELFSPVQDSHLVLLTVPAYEPNGMNCAPNGDGAGVRYLSETRMVTDQTTGRDERPVGLARKNFSLRLDDEGAEGSVSLAIARVRRDGAGRFVYDAEYVPPCLHIGASPRLMDLLGRLIEILEAKSDALGHERGAARPSRGGLTGRQVTGFWLLHAINSAAAPLRHHRQARHSRPEQLYLELARLAGALCTFGLDSHPRTIPTYDHEHLEECFAALDRHIRTHLEVTLPTHCVSIPLHRETAYLYTGAVADERCFKRSRWIIGIRSSIGDAETIVRVPQLVKVCSKRFTPELVKRAHSGLRLDHLPVPPAQISPRVDSQYFGISKAGPCWDTLVESREVGVYVPDALPDAELEMLVWLED